jgi:hypothetical protein
MMRHGALSDARGPDAGLASASNRSTSWAFLVTHDGLLAIRELSDQTMRFTTPEV